MSGPSKSNVPEVKDVEPRAEAPTPKKTRAKVEQSSVVEDLKAEWNGPLPNFLSVSAG